LFQKHKQKIIAAELNFIDELDELEAQEQKEHEKKTRREP
jgi:hypothetical protein